MITTYQADDGYVGKSRPLECEINDDELKECDSLSDAVQYAEDEIATDFAMKVAASYDRDKLAQQVADARGLGECP